MQCATERQDGGLGPAGSALLYDQGECFRNPPVLVPGLLCQCGRRWGRLQSGPVVWATHLQTAICACPQCPPARDRARIGPKYYGNEGTKESGGGDGHGRPLLLRQNEALHGLGEGCGDAIFCGGSHGRAFRGVPSWKTTRPRLGALNELRVRQDRRGMKTCRLGMIG